MGALFYFGCPDVGKDLAQWEDLEAVVAWIDDRTKGIIILQLALSIGSPLKWTGVGSGPSGCVGPGPWQLFE